MHAHLRSLFIIIGGYLIKLPNVEPALFTQDNEHFLIYSEKPVQIKSENSSHKLRMRREGDRYIVDDAQFDPDSNYVIIKGEKHLWQILKEELLK